MKINDISKVKPTAGKIIVKKIPEETETKSGIILTSKTASSTPMCLVEVVAVGSNDGVDSRETIVVKPGDIGVVGRVPYESLTVDEETYWFVKQPDIIAILEDFT